MHFVLFQLIMYSNGERGGKKNERTNVHSQLFSLAPFSQRPGGRSSVRTQHAHRTHSARGYHMCLFFVSSVIIHQSQQAGILSFAHSRSHQTARVKLGAGGPFALCLSRSQSISLACTRGGAPTRSRLRRLRICKAHRRHSLTSHPNTLILSNTYR